jgi:hypothetical protein
MASTQKKMLRYGSGVVLLGGGGGGGGGALLALVNRGAKNQIQKYVIISKVFPFLKSN